MTAGNRRRPKFEQRQNDRPDLDRQALPGWLRERLLVPVTPTDLDTALEAMRAEGMLDTQDRPQAERLSSLVNESGLRA